MQSKSVSIYWTLIVCQTLFGTFCVMESQWENVFFSSCVILVSAVLILVDAINQAVNKLTKSEVFNTCQTTNRK